MEGKANGLSIAGFVVSLVSLFLVALYGIAGLVGLILSAVGRSQAVREGGKPARTHYWVESQSIVDKLPHLLSTFRAFENPRCLAGLGFLCAPLWLAGQVKMFSAAMHANQDE